MDPKKKLPQEQNHYPWDGHIHTVSRIWEGVEFWMKDSTIGRIDLNVVVDNDFVSVSGHRHVLTTREDTSNWKITKGVWYYH